MRRYMRVIGVLAIAMILSSATNAASSESTYLYRVTLVQVAPGRLVDFIDAYKIFAANLPPTEEKPMWLRHSQGDHWDLMILTPMNSHELYYSAERLRTRAKAESTHPDPLKNTDLIATQEDVFVYGPPVAELRAAMDAGKFYHVEMFQALPAHHQDLLTERGMEKAYQHVLHRPENFLFIRDSGAAWDCFTIGVYRDLKHYAESADIPEEEQEKAARAAGFAKASDIGPTLRKYIRSHHDTLAVAVK